MVYDREVLMDVANRHHKVEIKGCICGYAKLGATIGEHVADVYEERMQTKSITCPRCGRTSYNLNDIREGYCGACHDWTRV